MAKAVVEMLWIVVSRGAHRHRRTFLENDCDERQIQYMSKENLHLLVVTVRVWNRDKLNFTNPQELFDPECPWALLEWFEVVRRPISVIVSVGNYQKNRPFVVIADQQAGVCDAITA
jgi:hypothetical protein